ncbi:serine hydrolase family protein [Candidatus Woesearchaeota archaeon]|nr:serine hydrolase family protein [Candidatus Woesearchaeota archaeon]
MVKRVFIIHGWEGYPEEGWFPWLKKELENRNFQVFVPAMPETGHPRIETWVPHLAKLVGKLDKETYFVGHSIGCQTILRYLQTIKTSVGGAIFVAGWVSLTLIATRTKEEQAIAKPWFETPIDFVKIKKTSSHFTAIFSDDDPYVPLENIATYREKLDAKIIIEKGKGHFSGEDNITKLPLVLKELLYMARER